MHSSLRSVGRERGDESDASAPGGDIQKWVPSPCGDICAVLCLWAWGMSGLWVSDGMKRILQADAEHVTYIAEPNALTIKLKHLVYVDQKCDIGKLQNEAKIN